MPELLDPQTPSEAPQSSSPVPQTPAGEDTQPIAPWWHTALLVLVLALWAAYGALRSSVFPIATGLPRSLMYGGQMLIQYLLVGSTVAGLYHRRRFLRDVFGLDVPEKLDGQARIVRDAGLGVLIFLGGVIATVASGAFVRPLPLSHRRDLVLALAPHNAGEMALWLLVSATAGLCEEFIFRGYLLRQCVRWLGSGTAAVVATSMLFGCLHLYEGTAAVVQIGVLGAFYGVAAMRQGNLRAVMIAHFLQDAVVGALIYLHPQM